MVHSPLCATRPYSWFYPHHQHFSLGNVRIVVGYSDSIKNEPITADMRQSQRQSSTAQRSPYDTVSPLLISGLAQSGFTTWIDFYPCMYCAVSRGLCFSTHHTSTGACQGGELIAKVAAAYSYSFRQHTWFGLGLFAVLRTLQYDR